MVISKRLYSLLKAPMCVKMNGDSYHVRLVMDTFHKNEQDITFYKDATEFNYFCFNKHSKITCWPTKNGEQPVNDQGQWKLEGRQEMKPGRFLGLLIDYLEVRLEEAGRYYEPIDSSVKAKVKARACEIFTDQVRGVNSKLDFEISPKIADVYALPSHSLSGYLRNSCMRIDSEHDCHDFAKFYETLKKVKIVHKVVNGELLFRALLWEGLVNPKTKRRYTFLDRIYGSESVNVQLINHAQEHGWAWRNFSDDDIRIGEEGKRLNGYLSMLFPKESLEYIQSQGAPYVDTMRYVRERHGKVRLPYELSSDCNKNIWSLDDPDGDPLDLIQHCNNCGYRIRADDGFHLEGNIYCEVCYNDLARECDICGEIHHRSNLTLCADDGKYYCSSCYEDASIVQCRICGKPHFVDNLMRHPNGSYYCKKCFLSRSSICSVCGKRELNSQIKTSVVIDGNLFCNVCLTCLNERTEKCFDCGSRTSGVLKFQESWYDVRQHYYCLTCREESKLQYVNDDRRREETRLR